MGTLNLVGPAGRLGAVQGLGLALLAGVSAGALAHPAAAQSSSYSEQIVNFAKAVDTALHGTGGTGMTAYSHEFAERGIDEHPQVNLSSTSTASAVTDCSGWVNYTLNTVAPIHHALVNDSRKEAPFASLGEGSKPYARAMVLQHYFNRMPVVGSSDTSKGFQQITDFAATSGTNSLQAGDVVAYCEGGWCTPEKSSGDTGHTFLVTGAPVAITAENYASTLGLGSTASLDGDKTLGKVAGDPELTVIAIPVIDSSTLTHYGDDRSFSAIPQSVQEAYPTEYRNGELSDGGLGKGYILIAVDSSGTVRQTRFANGDQWLPNDTSQSKGSNGKTFGAVRLTDAIALSEVLTVTKWSNTVDSFGGVDGLGQIAVDISGSAGGILLNGGGTLHLTGNNSYGAGTTVTDSSTLVVTKDGNLGSPSGSLTLANGILQVADGFASASDRALVLGSGGGSLQTADSSGAASWAGPVRGSGALNVARGHWTFSGSGSGYGGTASIASGAHMTVSSGSTLGGALTVASGGTLSGGGRVGHLSNSGTVAPGSTGTLTTSGAYTQSSSGALTINLAGASSHSRLVAEGAASLDGTLKAELAGGYVPAVGTSFTVLQAQSVSGTFSTIDASFSQTLVGKAGYSGTAVTLTAERDYANDKLHKQLSNADLRSVATALNERSSVRSGAAHAALSAIDRTTQASHTGEALHQLQPHNPSSHGRIATATATGHSSRVSSRLSALRGGGGNEAQSGLSAGDPAAAFAPTAGGDALTGTLMQLAADPSQIDFGRAMPLGMMDAGGAGASADRPLGVFAYGTGLLGYQDTTSEREGYRFDGGGLTVGLDYRLSDRLLVGLAGSYAQTRTSYQGGADTSDAETWSLGPYVMFTSGAFYLEGVASYAWAAYDNTRQVTLPGWTATSTSSPDGTQYSFYGGGGYDFAIAPGMAPSRITLGPTASLQYTHADVDGYTETGSNPFNLTVAGQSMTSLQSSLGARLRGDFAGGWGRVLPELRLSWSHEFDNNATTVTSQLAGGTIPFTTTGDDPVRDWINLGGEVALQLSDGVSLFASADGQMAFNRENAALAMNAGARIAF